MAKIKDVDNSKENLYLNSCNALFQYLNSIRYKKKILPLCELYTIFHEHFRKYIESLRNLQTVFQIAIHQQKMTNEFICHVYWLFGFITTLLDGVIRLKYRQSFDL